VARPPQPKRDPHPPMPPHRTCGQMEVHHRLLEQNPGFRTALAALESNTRGRMRALTPAALVHVTIPVVVHVLYNVAADNISQAQIASQIDALNRDYGAKNPDRSATPTPWKGLVSDTGIQFALATTDPQGQPTQGVTRTQTTKTSFNADDTCKSSQTGGIEPWPSDRFLNLWVCTLGGGLLGYAQFPGGPPATDGVVILNTAFGTSGTATYPFNVGRTAVHEVGHWLNLRHIWGDTEDCSGSDFVDDTPNAQHPNYGAPTFPHVSCTNGPNGDMFVNYMDYVDDRAMVMFTAGQVVRMQTTLTSVRSGLLGAVPVGPGV
jgi:Pregnancy-associated plasma protein-A